MTGVQTCALPISLENIKHSANYEFLTSPRLEEERKNDFTSDTCKDPMESTEVDLNKFWSLESIGIHSDELTTVDRRVYEKFQQSLRYFGNSYVVRFPWKENLPRYIPNNYALARSRLFSVIKRLRTTPALLDIYNDITLEQIQRGFVEVVGDDRDVMSDSPVIDRKSVV